MPIYNTQPEPVVTAQDEQTALSNARDTLNRNSLLMLGGGGAVYGGAKYLLDDKIKNMAREDYIKAGKINIDLGTSKVMNSPEMTEKLQRQLSDIYGGARARKLAGLRYLSMIGKGGGAILAATGGIKYLLGRGTQAIDPSGQGLLDDKYLKGERDKYLLAGGLAASAAGGLGSYLISKKLGGAILTPKVGIRDIIRPERMKRFENEAPFKLNKDFESILDKARKDTNNFNFDFKNSDEYKKMRKGATEGVEDMKDHLKKHNVKESDLKSLGIAQGIATAGGVASSDALASMLGNSEYKKELEEIKNKKRLEKSASFGMAAGLHALQNAIGAGLTKNDFLNRKLLTPYSVNALSEGYHGRAFDGKIGAALGGISNQLMPEMKAIQKGMRSLGKRLRDEKVDIHNMDKNDLGFLKAIAHGDFKRASEILPDSKAARGMVKAIFPKAEDEQIIMGAVEAGDRLDKKTLSKIQDIYKQTITHKTLKNVADHLEGVQYNPKSETGQKILNKIRNSKIGKAGEKALDKLNDKIHFDAGLSVPKGVPLDTYEKYNVSADNVAHAGLLALDPLTASFNGLKRIIVADPFKARSGATDLERKGVSGVNVFKKGVDFFFDDMPNRIANARGFIGKEDSYGPKARLALSAIVNPVVEGVRRDNYLFGRMGDTLTRAAEKQSLKAGEKSSGVLEHLDSMKDSSRRTLDELEGDGGIISGIYHGAKKTLEAAKENKINKKDVGAVFKMFSSDEAKRAEGEKRIAETAQRLYDENAEKAKKAVENNVDVALNAQKKAEDKIADINMRIERWKAPGLAIGGTALMAPMAKSMFDRNRSQNDDTNKLKKGLARAA